MKKAFKAVEADVWSASLSRSSHPVLKKEFGSRKTWEPDSYRINAERIINGELVSETWLWGRNAAALVEFGYLTERQLDPHREAFLADVSAIADPEEVRKEKEAQHEMGKRIIKESS